MNDVLVIAAAVVIGLGIAGSVIVAFFWVTDRAIEHREELDELAARARVRSVTTNVHVLHAAADDD